MDYKYKYNKYKRKYLELRGGLRDDNICLRDLDKLYKDKKNEIIENHFMRNIFNIIVPLITDDNIRSIARFHINSNTQKELDSLRSEINDDPNNLKNILKEILTSYEYPISMECFYDLFTFIGVRLPNNINTISKYKTNYANEIQDILDTNYELKILNNIIFINRKLISELKEIDGNRRVLDINEICNIFDNKINNHDFDQILEKYNYLKNNITAQYQKYIFVEKEIKPYLFFLKIMENYIMQDNYILGDSCIKFKYMYDILDPENNINVLHFSGNMYENDYICPKNHDPFINNYLKYYNNNKQKIDQLFSTIKSDNKKVIIYDFTHTGNSILTFIEVLICINQDIFKIENFEYCIKNKILFILQILTSEILEINKLKNKLRDINYIFVSFPNIDIDFYFHFINSDRNIGDIALTKICSRCISYYDPSKWGEPPEEVYCTKNPNDDYNYIGCNLNKMYLYLLLISEYKKGVKLSDIDLEYLDTKDVKIIAKE